MRTQVEIALQLYSLRTIIQERLPETLKKLADMGYAGVEFAGVYGRTASELGALLSDTGLRCAGAHVSLDALSAENFNATADLYRSLGTDRLIVPAAPLSDLDALIDTLNAIHARARAAGLKSGFHNHAGEFEPRGGTNAFDRIFAETPEDFLVQVDIGWAVCAGQDVPALLRRYASRIETVHIKEFREGDMTVIVGDGDVDWPPIMSVLQSLPCLEWLVIEQEQHSLDPLESVRHCLVNTERFWQG